MWKTLPQCGSELREVRLEGSGKDRELVIAPRVGAAIRFPTGDVSIETVGRVSVRVTTTERGVSRVTFAGEAFMLDHAEVDFDGSENDWDAMWRRARMRSRPWWQGSANEELDLDWAMPARLVLTASTTRSSTRPPSIRPPPSGQ